MEMLRYIIFYCHPWEMEFAKGIYEELSLNICNSNDLIFYLKIIISNITVSENTDI